MEVDFLLTATLYWLKLNSFGARCAVLLLSSLIVALRPQAFSRINSRSRSRARARTMAIRRNKWNNPFVCFRSMTKILAERSASRSRIKSASQTNPIHLFRISHYSLFLSLSLSLSLFPYAFRVCFLCFQSGRRVIPLHAVFDDRKSCRVAREQMLKETRDVTYQFLISRMRFSSLIPHPFFPDLMG